MSARKKSMLYTAAENDDSKMLKILLASEANIEIICNGFTALHIASYHGHHQIVKLLLDHGAKVNDSELSKQTPLSSIVASNVAANIEYDGWNSSLAAMKTIRILIRYGADINCHPFPLCQAVQMGRLHLVKLLLKKGANTKVIDRGEQTPLLHACEQFDAENMLEILRCLLEISADPNHKEPLITLCRAYAVDSSEKQIAFLEVLIKYGANIDVKTGRGEILLMMVSKQESYPVDHNIEIIRTLLKFGADPEVVNDEDESAILFAAINANVDVVLLLFEYGDNINFRNKQGRQLRGKGGHVKKSILCAPTTGRFRRYSGIHLRAAAAVSHSDDNTGGRGPRRHSEQGLTSMRRCRVSSQGLQTANTMALKKPGKEDYTTPKAYRPIALLNTLGKAVESIMARKITYLAEKYNLLPSTHMGARRGRSTESTLELLTEQVHTVWGQGKNKVATLLSIDVSGAFDTVSHPRLLHNLRKRQIPQ